MRVYVKVKGFQNCKQEFAWESKVPRLRVKVHAGVKRFQNCKHESTHESRVLGMGA